MSTLSKPTRRQTAWGPFGLFVAINLTAFSLATIGAGNASQLGILSSDTTPFPLILMLTACIAFPLSAMAAQHRLDIERLSAAFLAGAPIDQLTGLIDRQFFKRVIEDELTRMERSGRPSAIGIFEIDQFQSIKDRYGPSLGNAALRHVSVTAHAQLRGPFDKVSRWTDNSFIMLMNDVSIAQAEHICDRLRTALFDQEVHHKGQAMYITASFGVSSFAPGGDSDEALAMAKAGLEAAQRYGGNKVCNSRR